MRPRYFKNSAKFRSWLAKNHAGSSELLIGYYKRHTGKPSMTWSESVDVALCFGWIDGIRRKVDEDRYTIRFTPRRPNSVWSQVNLEKVKALKKSGRMRLAGLEVYEARNRESSQRYSFEKAGVGLDPEYERAFKQKRKAWAWFQDLAPSYRKQSIWWVMSAKKALTRKRRLAALMECSAEGRKIRPLRRPGE